MDISLADEGSLADAGWGERQTFGSVGDFAESARDWPVTWRIQSGESGFAARLRRRTFGDFLFGELQYAPCTGVRDDDEIARSGERYICLTQYGEGHLNFSQDGKAIEIERNDLVLWDASIPTTFDCPAPTRCNILWIPARLVERRIGRVEHFLSRRVSPAEGASRILAPYLTSLHGMIGDVPEAIRASVLDASIELIFSCFQNSVEESALTRRSAELLARAKREIADRIELGEVNPREVAQALGIGIRYLHKIFAAAGLTFATWVGHERLERAHQVLLNPRLRSLTTTEIAHRFGYYDSSHFNRSFKRRYGLTPAAYRASRLG